ncbi:hypothetical protein [Rhodoferax saidenbachensis]|uniref:Peptidase S9 prolyl oligopeptidase catalytic domain-containing protein n=1 Tax=Rhodoferax saidenbachensis TaxID=1484693 RepID=A0ABU1ZIG3_9BURK|nr:hypothetical protein [Rhodoferax saidenbachensis]MDR7305330.1 hypothetical protein [Rhodoferax saidenbachensis]
MALLWALAGGACLAQSDNEVFLFDDVLRPKTISQVECLALPHAVWVAPRWVEAGFLGRKVDRSAQGCIRYFPSAKAQGAQTAVFFIHGDVMGLEDHPDQNREVYEKTGSYKAQIAQADRTAKDIGLPVIRIARPGVYGSTGMSHVRERRLPMEAYLVNAAITTIKERYGYHRILLTGLSGGGGLVGAALTLGRTDTDCAVVGSGAVSMKTRARLLASKEALRGLDQTGQLLSDVYDPIDHVNGVLPDSRRRIFVLGDPRDRSVAFESQQEFQQRLLSVGIPATLLTAEAKDAMHHRTAPEAQRVAAWCLAGVSDADIQNRLNAGP